MYTKIINIILIYTKIKLVSNDNYLDIFLLLISLITLVTV